MVFLCVIAVYCISGICFAVYICLGLDVDWFAV